MRSGSDSTHCWPEPRSASPIRTPPCSETIGFTAAPIMICGSVSSILPPRSGTSTVKVPLRRLTMPSVPARLSTSSTSSSGTRAMVSTQRGLDPSRRPLPLRQDQQAVRQITEALEQFLRNIAVVGLGQDQQAAAAGLLGGAEAADHHRHVEAPQRLHQRLVAERGAGVGAGADLEIGIVDAEHLEIDHADEGGGADRDDREQGAGREQLARAFRRRFTLRAHARAIPDSPMRRY